MGGQKPTGPGMRRIQVAAFLLAGAWAVPAAAATCFVQGPSFFRTGPGTRFVVLQELSRGTMVDVQSCAEQWCRVQLGRVTGYVSQVNLGQQAPPSQFPAQPADAAGCFDARRAGHGEGEVFRYCPEPPPR